MSFRGKSGLLGHCYLCYCHAPQPVEPSKDHCVLPFYLVEACMLFSKERASYISYLSRLVLLGSYITDVEYNHCNSTFNFYSDTLQAL